MNATTNPTASGRPHTTKLEQLAPAEITWLASARESDEKAQAAFAEIVFKHGAIYAMRWHGEPASTSEHMLRWHKGIEYVLGERSDEDDCLESLLEEVTERLLDWSPNQSTCRFTNATADAEHSALKVARDLLHRILSCVKARLRIAATEAVRQQDGPEKAPPSSDSGSLARLAEVLVPGTGEGPCVGGGERCPTCSAVAAPDPERGPDALRCFTCGPLALPTTNTTKGS